MNEEPPNFCEMIKRKQPLHLPAMLPFGSILGLMLLSMIFLAGRLWARPAGVEVSGNITTDTVWTKVNSPYLVTASLQVMANVTLTIQAGVIVKFADNTGLSVTNNAQLLALGTASQPVVFTSIRDDSQGGDSNGDGGVTVPTPGETIPKRGQSYSEQHVYHFMGGDSFQQMQPICCSNSSSGQR